MTNSNPTKPSDSEVPRSTGRVLDLLEIVLGAGTCNLTTAAESAELTPTTALRHLRALESRGYLDRDEAGLFSAGPALLRLAASLQTTGRLEHLVNAAQPHLEELASTTGESTYLAVSDGRRATYIATAESERSIRHVGGVGQVVQLQGTAVGGALEDPGAVVVRTGAVESDITAVSVSLGTYEKLGVAISIVGPESRFREDSLEHATVRAAGIAADLARTLGIDPTTASTASEIAS